MSETDPRETDARIAGRGFIVITAAKLWFMVGGAVITFGLPWIFDRYGGDVPGSALYGQYIDVNNTLSILSMVMITGVMQSVSKFVAERPDAAGGIQRQALRMMLVVSALVGGGFVLAAPWIAAARNNPELTLGYRFAGAILFFYGVYTVFIGVLNGRKRFLSQAKFDMLYTTIKAGLVFGLAAAGLGVVGAFGGFAAAAGLICVLAAVIVSRQTAPGDPEPRLYAFAAQVMLYTLVFNFIFKLDVLLLKPLGAEALAQGGGVVTSAMVDSLIGQYGLAVGLSRIPWQATIAITFVVFPLISQATFQADHERTRLYVRQTLRYTLLAVAGAGIVLTALSADIVGIWPEKYSTAAIALTWLAPAYVAFSLFNVVNTILTSAGRASTVLGIGVSTIALAALLYWLVLPGAPSPEALLMRVSAATLAAFTGGLCIGLTLLWRSYGSPVPAATVVRVALVAGALVAAGRQLPTGGGLIITVALAGAIGLAYVVLLAVLGEFGADDRARLMSVLRRRSP